MMTYEPAIGDVVLVKGTGLVARLIQRSFRRGSPLKWAHDPLPSNHNGIVGVHNGMWCVFQAAPGGFDATPWAVELQLCYMGRQEMKVARHAHLTAFDRQLMNAWLISHIGTPYDYVSYISHIWRSALRLTPLHAVQSDRRFYCTEAVKMAYRLVGKDFTLNDMPTPFTVEKRLHEGGLTLVAEFPQPPAEG